MMLVLAEYYRARSSSGFGAYMQLQQALLARWLARGGTTETWCERMAPAFRARYGRLADEGVVEAG
jgi:DNA-binding transcriptional MocR family regulator